MFWTSLQVYSGILRQRFAQSMLPSLAQQPSAFPALIPTPQLAGMGALSSNAAASVLPQQLEDLIPSIWFAVPKRKHTKSRKRMKTTVQKRIPLKKNIVFDPRTGEVTLKHKLPFNWKDYLPKAEE